MMGTESKSTFLDELDGSAVEGELEAETLWEIRSHIAFPLLEAVMHTHCTRLDSLHEATKDNEWHAGPLGKREYR